MMSQPPPNSGRTVIVVGAGFSGSLFALKLAQASPTDRIILIAPEAVVGRGVAYGACAPIHLLNVPVARMDVGLQPGFAEWLSGHPDALAEALAESGGDLAGAFVPRALFGAYLEARLMAACSNDRRSGIVRLRGEAVALLDPPARGVVLLDGRQIVGDILVLATGNLPPKAPLPAESWMHDAAEFTPDPWAAGGPINDSAAPVVLLGTGLTMVDVALRLAAEGQRGPIHAVSRRGLLPTGHQAGGVWAPFLAPHLPASPRRLTRLVRVEIARAEAFGVPWQRVMDAVRPVVARIWSAWSESERAQFLRHLRPRWDVHRHRMAPRIQAGLSRLIETGALTVHGGRITGYKAGPQGIVVTVRPRGTRAEIALAAGRVINCTGPRSDLAEVAIPLFADLRRRGLIRPDRLGLGLESDDCAVCDAYGRASNWLFALGPLTRPAWWEITAVPEITAQVRRLVDDLAFGDPAASRSLADMFVDIGAGI